MYVGHDLGTGGNKAVLVDHDGALLAIHTTPYALHHPHHGWAEQDPADWWAAVCEGTRAVLAGRDPAEVRAVTFAGQMLALVPMDAAGDPVRPALSWMDARADAQAARLTRRLGGRRIVSALAGAAPTGKDLVAKMAWLRECEPEVFRATAAFGDATSFLVGRATGRLALDPTAAGCTGAYQLAARRWSRVLPHLVGLPLHKMPPVVPSSSVAGRLTQAASAALGLPPGVPVAMGMSDIPAAAVGSGAVRPGQGHLYLGTSAWVGVSLDTPTSIPRAGIASVPGADRTGSLLIAESETAGACRDWIATQLGDAPEALAATVPPGCDGLLFCPWMWGERSPFPSEHVRGAFLNLGLAHTRAHLARAVLEGVALNVRWILESIDATGVRQPGLRVIGGGARSDVWLQILADVTGETLTRVARPQHAGAVGAALLGAVAVGDLPDVSAIAATVEVDRTFTPQPHLGGRYDAHLRALRTLAPSLAATGRALGGRR